MSSDSEQVFRNISFISWTGFLITVVIWFFVPNQEFYFENAVVTVFVIALIFTAIWSDAFRKKYSEKSD